MLVFGWNPRTRRKTSHSWAEKGTLQQTRSHITESFLVCNYNRAEQEFCTCSTVFGTFLLPSWDEYDVEFHFYQRSQHKSTTFFSFFWTDLKTDNPFCGMKQWMVVIRNGNFYPWQNRLLISILFITITKFSNLIGYQLSLFQHSRTARAQLNAFFSLLAKRSRTFLCFKFKKGLKYHKCCYSYD